MTKYEEVQQQLLAEPKVWLVTGVAGFIGSNLLETLLKLNQSVVGLDNFSTGFQHNLDEVRSLVSEEQWARFQFVEGDICDLATCRDVLTHGSAGKVHYVLHQAALGSVPRSIDDPINTNRSNIDGFLNMLVAAKDAKVDSFTYAASSSTYGDHPALPKVEENIGNPLSPYAVTKYVNELYADVFARVYDFKSIGLRYFNVFGPRQNPNGAYAAVIPKWIGSLLNGDGIAIYGDGSNSRDFTYVKNAVQANILSACSKRTNQQVLNIAVGDEVSLIRLSEMIEQHLLNFRVITANNIKFLEPRIGDVKHSRADIQAARKSIGYEPLYLVSEGLIETVKWFCDKYVHLKDMNKNQ